MTYGLFVKNAADDTIIDSADDIGHYYAETTGTGLGTTVSSGTTIASGLLCARPSGTFTGSGRVISLKSNSVSGTGLPSYFTDSGTLQVIRLKKFAGNISSLSGTGAYGLEIKNSAGTPILNTGVDALFSIIEIGSFGTNYPGSGIFNVPIPSTVPADKVFVMLQNTQRFAAQLSGGGILNTYFVLDINYAFNFNTDPKTISVRAITANYHNSSQTNYTGGSALPVQDLAYMIGYIRG